MLEAIAKDSRDAALESSITVVLLGDLVDRGAHSRQVIELAMAPPLPATVKVVTLMGNHEQMMLEALRTSGAVAPWLSYGGSATAASYGISPIVGTPTPERVERLRVALATALPEYHRSFLASLPSHWRCGDYVFAHAGVRPGTPLAQQRPNDLLWAGKAFLDSTLDHGAVVVHGHHVAPEAEIHSNRIGIDTGAYCTGILTCLVLEGDTRALIQVGPDGVRKSALPPRQHPPA